MSRRRGHGKYSIQNWKKSWKPNSFYHFHDGFLGNILTQTKLKLRPLNAQLSERNLRPLNAQLSEHNLRPLNAQLFEHKLSVDLNFSNMTYL